ncbi:plant specific mitochondrial import receptor subunit TOM20 [Artemisia annua]|uniref:Plant specific mitochondrial import receptor subunit TOM20 n=1 Tax=Artemisia annua TaxID=35608 RepID=A0A2U1KKH0_ARTAN|nr:plant specific mitochondrial import receptor subunit TOM20 [Artemisia annua]
MEQTQQDFERLLMSETYPSTAEAAYNKNPYDADNLTKWGGALLELSQFGNINESKKMIKDAVSKFDEALAINPAKHEATWCLGNAYTTQGFLNPDHDEAQILFEQASECFQKAVDECPGNESYLQSLANASRASELHNEVHKAGGLAQTQQALGGGAGASSSNAKRGSGKKKSNDLMYDVCGWIILAVGIVAWVGMAKSHMPQ